MAHASRFRFTLCTVFVALSAVACRDAYHDDQVDALGAETPGVPKGPLHRPGQPCLVCHGEYGPADSEFSVAGTVYLVRREEEPAVGAVVTVEDITGQFASATTNEAGNFFIKADAFRPNYPMKAKIDYLTVSRPMSTTIGREGSCSGCHKGDASQTSPGHIYVAPGRSGLPK